MSPGERRAAWLLAAALVASVALNAVLALRGGGRGAAAAAPPAPSPGAAGGSAATAVAAAPAAEPRVRPCPTAATAATGADGAAAGAGSDAPVPAGNAWDRAPVDGRWEAVRAEPIDPVWGPAQGALLRARADRLAAGYKDARVVSAECRATCCQVAFEGDDADHAGDELGTSAGFWGWSNVNAMRETSTGDGGTRREQTICFDRSSDGPPPTFVDRLDERDALLAKAAPALAACRGLPGAPGGLYLRINIAADGSIESFERRGGLQGTEAAACVENAVEDAAHFAPAAEGTVLALSFWVDEAAP